MSQYQTILKTVEALLWTGENEAEMKAFIGEVKSFSVMPDKIIMVQEMNNEIDYISLHHYVIKTCETFASTTKDNFERDYELKE